MKPIRDTELVKILPANGAEKVRTVGSPETWKVGSCQAVVPRHPTIAAGTLRNIQDRLAPCIGKGWFGQ